MKLFQLTAGDPVAGPALPDVTPGTRFVDFVFAFMRLARLDTRSFWRVHFPTYPVKAAGYVGASG